MERFTSWDFLSPSATLLKYADELSAGKNVLTLDLGCGLGRNAIVMASYGSDVICVDHDLNRLRHLEALKSELLGLCPIQDRCGTITTVCADLSEKSWPFVAEAFHVVISVHFNFIALIPSIVLCLRPGGYLYLETFGGQGQNHLDLPRPGETKFAVGDQAKFIYYRERPASRRHSEAVTVKALARKV
jgi:SAM-dependent methyltransferase